MAPLLVGATFTVFGLGGCTAPLDERGTWPEPRPIGSDVPAVKPSDKREEEAAEPTGVLTLKDAVMHALRRSPELTAFGWEVRAREARILQADVFQNPVLSADVENLPGRSRAFQVTGGVQTTIQLGQVIELGGKRASRVLLATAERDVAGWDYEVERIAVLSRVSQRFVNVLGAQQSVQLAEEALKIARQSFEAASERVKAGQASPIEESKAKILVASADIRLERAKHTLQAARRQLSITWGSRTARFDRVAGDLDTFMDIPTLQRLEGRLAKNPTLARWAAEITKHQAAVESAEAGAVPDLNLSAGYRLYSVPGGNDVSTFQLGVSIPLPIFDRNQGAIMEAQSRLARARAQQESAEVLVSLELESRHRNLALTRAEAVSLRDNVLSSSQAVLDAVLAGYRIGKFSLLEVLDAQRALSLVRVQYLQAAMDFHKEVVEVERLIGERLDSVE